MQGVEEVREGSERGPRSAVLHEDVRQSQPSSKKTISQPPLKIAGGQDATSEGGPKVECMDASKNCEDDEKELSLRLVAIVALMQR